MHHHPVGGPAGIGPVVGGGDTAGLRVIGGSGPLAGGGAMLAGGRNASIGPVTKGGWTLGLRVGAAIGAPALGPTYQAGGGESGGAGAAIDGGPVVMVVSAMA